MKATTNSKRIRGRKSRQPDALDSVRPVETPAGPGDPSTAALEEFRQRLLVVRSILDNLFGPATEANPELWQRGAYLTLIASVVYTLVDRQKELSTQELVQLAKALEAASPKSGAGAAASRTSRNGESRRQAGATESGIQSLPPYFSDIVRQIYGTQIGEEGAESSLKTAVPA